MPQASLTLLLLATPSQPRQVMPVPAQTPQTSKTLPFALHFSPLCASHELAAAALFVPIGQAVHELAPAALYVPSVHGVHALGLVAATPVS